MYKLTARFHQPNRLMTRPGMPAIAAEVAAPMRKLWVLYSEARYPAWESRWQAERDRGVPSRKQEWYSAWVYVGKPSDISVDGTIGAECTGPG